MLKKAIDSLYDYNTEFTNEKRDEIATLIDDMQNIINMCFDDSCSSTGKIRKKTALKLIKYRSK